MRLQITIKQQNPNFNKDYADEYNFGKEGDGNWKDNWSRGYELQDEIEKLHIEKNVEYNLVGKLENGKEINVLIPNMTILKTVRNDKTISQVAISTDLVKRTLKTPYNEKYNITRFYFYLKPRQDFFTIDNFTYILEKDIPKELK
ncbi:hypothetical protein SAMN05444411_1256 [Lutibacter oricola]|uniref:Uncharacterized protein n=1 Tax=Lutibacter oricola TaxID=762486 RepID=A0A1H3H3Y1_9FLAO|nr:hypothetical protein [Lutibacter oricola]SDY10216.1 hypothetical protein SAMN05444411_1256 [Lutibacter oricola]